jgi:glutamyl-tRNA synthetase
VDGAPSRTVDLPYHPQKDLGSRTVKTSGEFYLSAADLGGVKEGSVFRLMDLYNAELTSSGPPPRAKYSGDELIPNSRKFQWVTDAHEEVEVLVPDVLFLEGDVFNKESLKSVIGFAEQAASTLEVGDIIQFPRFGFCRLDSPGRFIMSG